MSDTEPVTHALVSPTEARELTDRLRARLAEATLLLVEAYETRCWLALGYRTWGQYVGAELGLSTAAARRRLAHGRILEAFRDMGMAPPRLSIGKAAAVVERLPEIRDADDPAAALAAMTCDRDMVLAFAHVLTPMADRVTRAAVGVQRSPEEWVRDVVAHALYLAGQ